MKEGDIYWLKKDLDTPHPRIIIDIIDNKAFVCSLTTNMSKVYMPGNILLDIGEGSLIKQSIVEVYKNEWIELITLGDYIGTLSPTRVQQIKNGIGFIERSFF